jgi:hypothetical protein
MVIDSKRFNEVVVSLRLDNGLIRITPLGIYRQGNTIIARIFPGTRLYNDALKAYEACLVAPSTPILFYDAVLNKEIKLMRPRSISTPCPHSEGLIIEAVVEGREKQKDGKYVIRFMPVYIYSASSTIKPYSRDYGCSIELLIAFTRIKFWSTKLRPTNCIEISRNLKKACIAFECILHATWDEELHRRAFEVLRLSYSYASMSGCPEPICENHKLH